jgi:hypothetical protein
LGIINVIKRAGGVTQAVEHLVCKQETLHSNPSPTKKKKKKKKNSSYEDQEDVVPSQTVCQPRQDSISKITRVKQAGGVVQEVACLLCKGKALSSNPCPTTKKKKDLLGSYIANARH